MAFKKRKNLYWSYNPFKQVSRDLNRAIVSYRHRCRICNKPLSDSQSVACRVGPDCRRKLGIQSPVISKPQPIRSSGEFPAEFRRFVGNVMPRSPPRSSPTLNKVASDGLWEISSAAFPQYAPMISMGRLMHSHGKEIKSVIDSMLSDSSSESKIATVVSTGKSILLPEARRAIASACAEKITGIIDSKNIFSKLNETTGLGIYSPQSNFKNFFQATAGELIQGVI